MADMEAKKAALEIAEKELDIAERQLKLALKISREVKKQSAETARDYQRLKRESRFDLLKETFTSHGIDYLLSEIARNPDKDYTPVLETYKKAIDLVYDIEQQSEI